MDKLFDSHWVLRITALILAVLLFFYVKALMDNDESVSSNAQMDIITDVPVEAYYDKENLIVTGLPETVDVTIEGPVQIVLKTKLTKDFKLFVDLSSLLIGEHRVKIQSENFSDKLEVSIDPKFIDISIEEKVTAELKIEPEMNNGLIAEGFELTGMTAEPSTVFVTGAKSIVNSISYVKATVSEEEGINSSFKQEANVKVLDKNLNKLDVTIEPAIVNVEVDIQQYSREVPISIQQAGTPMEGITVNSLTTEIEAVEVYGPKSIVDSLTELVVEFDISNIEKSGTYEYKLVVPNGATRLSRETIEIEADVTAQVVEQEEAVETEETITDEPETEEAQTEESESATTE